jgi:hypothetical protein
MPGTVNLKSIFKGAAIWAVLVAGATMQIKGKFFPEQGDAGYSCV